MPVLSRCATRDAIVVWFHGEQQGSALSSMEIGIQSSSLSPFGGVKLYLVC